MPWNEDPVEVHFKDLPASAMGDASNLDMMNMVVDANALLRLRPGSTVRSLRFPATGLHFKYFLYADTGLVPDQENWARLRIVLPTEPGDNDINDAHDHSSESFVEIESDEDVQDTFVTTDHHLDSSSAAQTPPSPHARPSPPSRSPTPPRAIPIPIPGKSRCHFYASDSDSDTDSDEDDKDSDSSDDALEHRRTTSGYVEVKGGVFGMWLD